MTEKEPEVVFIDDWDLGEIRAMSPEAILASKLFGYKAIHGLKDGERVETSPIIGFDGEHALTLSGGKVKLGKPKKDYVEFCKKVGCHVPTEEEPMKVINCSNEEWKQRQDSINGKRKELGI